MMSTDFLLGCLVGVIMFGTVMIVIYSVDYMR
jgi:hypothetical protein